MSAPTTQELRATWTRRRAQTNVGPTRAVVDLLADGRPVTLPALAATTGWTVEELRSYLDRARATGVEVDGDTIVGAALTLRQTEHRFRVRGNDLYTWCGFDALFLPIMLGERAEVVSTCPVTGVEIQLTVDMEGRVLSASPSTVAVGIVGDDVTSRCYTAGPGSAICSQMPLFASREAGERWLVDHPGVAVVSLDDAREVALTYVRGI